MLAADVEFTGAVQHADGVSWQHFRCPDGTVTEITGPGRPRRRRNAILTADERVAPGQAADPGSGRLAMPRYLHGDPAGRITIDCADPARLASFWSALPGITVTGEHSDTGWATAGSRLDHQPRLTSQRVPEPKTAKVRIHLDIRVDDIGAARRQAENLGGRWSGERHDYDDGTVIVVHDPENHEFCLVQYHD